MEYTLSEDFAHKIPLLALPPPSCRQPAQSARAPAKFGYGTLNLSKQYYINHISPFDTITGACYYLR